MKYLDVASRSAGSLWSSKLRTLLTTSAIAVGAFAMTFGIALNQGGGDYADKILTANIDAHSLWVMKKQDEKGSTLYPSHYTGNAPIWFKDISVKQMEQGDLDSVANVKGVTDVRPVFIIYDAFITRQGQDEYQAVVNVDRGGTYKVYIAGDGSSLGNNDIVLSDGYRQALGFATPEEAIGQIVSLSVVNRNDPNQNKKTMKFTVRAVIKQSSLSLTVAPMAVLVSDKSAKALNDYIVKGTPLEKKFTVVNAKVSASEDLNVVKQRIIDAGYFAQTQGDVYSAMYQFVGVLRFVLVIFGIIAVLTAVFGIINTQYISVLERVQEIGLMKALGMSGKDVRKLFQIEAGLIGFVGSTIGTTMALLIGTAINPFVASFLMLDAGVELTTFTVLSTVGVIVVLTVTALLAGLPPAKRAAALDPIDALRSEQL